MALAPTLKTWLLVLPAVAVLGVAGYRASGHAVAPSAVRSDAPGVVSAVDHTAALPVVVDARVAAGAAWIESGYGATAPLGAGRVTVVSA